MPRLSLVLALVIAASPAVAQTAGHPLALPTGYHGDRFWVEPVTAAGRRITLYTDSGGGLFLLQDAAARLGIEVTTEVQGADTVRLATFPPFAADASIPLPPSRGGKVLVFAPPPGRGIDMFEADGMLGQEWFGGRTWTFDYPGRTLWLRANGDVPAVAAEHRVGLGFQTDSAGARALNFPRIQATIDGQMLDLLLDTGATSSLTTEAMTAMGGTDSVRATSFITTTTFERWRSRHPDWRVVEKGEKATGEPLIEVPEVTVAGYTVGPVWFTRRPDRNFHQFMTRFMDRQVEGALGGSALHYFKVTVDYPNAIAAFERPATP